AIRSSFDILCAMAWQLATPLHTEWERFDGGPPSGLSKTLVEQRDGGLGELHHVGWPVVEAGEQMLGADAPVRTSDRNPRVPGMARRAALTRPPQLPSATATVSRLAFNLSATEDARVGSSIARSVDGGRTLPAR